MSPRFSLAYGLDKRTDLRLSVGRYYQSQGIHELQVEDGGGGFFPAQRADHAIVGLQHRFDNGYALRADAYWKYMERLRPRIEPSSDPAAPIVTFGIRNTDRFGNFATLDLRASYLAPVGDGELSVFFELSNATNRDNPCCVDFDLDTDATGAVGWNKRMISGYPYCRRLACSGGFRDRQGDDSVFGPARRENADRFVWKYVEPR